MILKMSQRWIWGWLMAVLVLVAPAVVSAQEGDGADTSTDEGEWIESAPAEGHPAGGDTAAAAAPTPSANAAPGASDTYADTDPAALRDFRPYLDPHGRWVDDPAYGLVWVPYESSVGPDFAPYVTNGHWGLTDDGEWIWVSNYQFGWVVFHYGRWVWIPDHGWSWVPGREYAHAWVVWRVPTGNYAYVGWAPMPPAYGWHGGVAVGLWFTPPTPYVFCPSVYVYDYHVHRHIVVQRTHVRYAARRTQVYRVTDRRSPRPARARVPARALPKQRTPANPSAVAASSPSTSKRIIKPGYRAKPLPGSTTARRSARHGGAVAAAPGRRAAPRGTRLNRTRNLGSTPAHATRPPAQRGMTNPRARSNAAATPTPQPRTSGAVPRGQQPQALPPQTQASQARQPQANAQPQRRTIRRSQVKQRQPRGPRGQTMPPQQPRQPKSRSRASQKKPRQANTSRKKTTPASSSSKPSYAKKKSYSRSRSSSGASRSRSYSRSQSSSGASRSRSYSRSQSSSGASRSHSSSSASRPRRRR